MSVQARQKMTVPRLQAKKARAEKITVITAYDYPFAKLIDEAGSDVILVGDTLGIVVQGHESTLPVTMDQMVYHTEMVSRATEHALVVADMPFMSYQVSLEATLHNAGRLIKEGGAAAVKFEGGREVADRVKALTQCGIPVMAHIGLTPQSVHQMGGYKVQGRDEKSAITLMEDAAILSEAGAFSLLLEGLPTTLASEITKALSIPTIGIGAGPACDGQVLVLHDLLGLFTRFQPKFVRRYANLSEIAQDAFTHFKSDVESGEFPNDDESYT